MISRPALVWSLLLFGLSAAGCSGDPPTIKVTERPADGVTQAAMDQRYLTALEQWTRRNAEEHLRESYRRNDSPVPELAGAVSTDAFYLENGRRKLAVVEVAYRGTPVRLTRVSGVKGESLVTVSCTAPRGEPIDVMDAGGACGGKVNSVFFE